MKTKQRGKGLVLVVDDDQVQRFMLRPWLESEGYAVQEFESGQACLESLNDVLPDAICLDLSMPGLSGLDTLKVIKSNHPLVPVVIFTADASPDSIVTAMQAGAYDYMVKPVDRTKLLTTLNRGIDSLQMAMRMTELEREAGQRRGYAGILGKSPVMKELFRQMDRVAASNINLLIQGESGSGKELVARAVHENSARGSHPLVAVNCAAIPETLQESELFGHERGAFTGATNQRHGRFEEANGGTLFLDEVAELSLPAQAKLLRVLQEKIFRRVGGSAEIRSDFRLIAATHRDLASEVEAGRFREDLYFRIDVFELAIPPLRERTDDVLLLANAFLKEFGAERDEELGQELEFSPETIDTLVRYRWPGNVRELRNAIERAVVSAAENVVRPEDLPRRVRAIETKPAPEAPMAVINALNNHDEVSPAEPTGQSNAVAPEAAEAEAAIGAIDVTNLTLEELEHKALEAALEQHRGNLAEVVRHLGIGRTTLYRKLKKYGLR